MSSASRTQTISTLNSECDAALDPFRSIKASVPSAGTFVAESELVLERVVANGFDVVSVLTSPSRLERVLAIVGTSTDIFVAPNQVIDAVVGFKLHRRVVAIVMRRPPVTLDLLLSAAKRIVVTEAITDPDNLGSICRHCACFGVDGVVMIGGGADPFYRKTIRSSMGWSLAIPVVQSGESASDLVAIKAAGFVLLALTPASSAMRLVDAVKLVAGGRVALMVGSEGPGLSERALAEADLHARIPMAPGVDSLNVATATAIALYSLTQDQATQA